MDILTLNCEKCPLNGRRRITDNQLTKADILIITESPGQMDIAKDSPLSDSSGQALVEVLKQLGISSYETITATACMTPEGRPANRAELSACKGRIISALATVKPKYILALGASATITLFGTQTNRGKWTEYEGIPTICTYAPGYVLKNRKRFSEWVEHISKLAGEQTKWKEFTYEILDSEQKVVNYLLECMGKDFIALDYETTSLSPFGNKAIQKAIPLCATMSHDGDHAVLIPCHLITGRALNLFKLVCESKYIVGSNFADYDWKISNVNYGIYTNKVFDTVIAHYLLDENAGENGLKKLSQLYLEAPDWETEMKPYIKKMADCPIEVMAPYATCDAIASYRLGKYLRNELDKEGFTNLYDTLIRSSIPVLSAMSCHGVRMNLDAQDALGKQLDADMAEIEQQANEVVGRPINLKSPKQLAEYWYKEKGYSSIKTGKSGEGSTDDQARKYLTLKYDDDLAVLVGEYSKFSKLKGTYVDGLSKRLDSDGRLHTSFLLQITSTGRLSSRNPNLQNIPKRKGKQIRQMFLPDEGMVFADCDYSNLEVRVGAMESQDEILTGMINSGIDVHRRVASMIYGIPEDDVTDTQRTYAKTGTFGVMYGMTEEGASARLGLSKQDAFELVKGIKNIFRGLDEWATYMCDYALTHGCVVTRYGRVRRFPIIVDRRDIAGVRRRAVNTPIQSLASDICLNALNNMHKLSSFFIPQLVVHDSICGSIREVTHENVLAIKQIMTTIPFATPVQFNVDCSFGQTWGDVKPYENPH